MKTYMVKRAVPDAMKIKLHLGRTGKGMELAVYELAELLDNMREYGHTEEKHRRAEGLIDFLYGTMDSLEHVGEELDALAEATLQEKQTEAVRTVLTTAPEKRNQIDRETLWLAGVHEGHIEKAQEPQELTR